MKNSIKLPDPQKELEFPLMKALEKRRTIRKWKDTPVSEQEIIKSSMGSLRYHKK